MSVDDDTPEKNAEVGYRKPPVHSRFRKGHSGNPKGRLRHNDPERVSSLFWREAGRLLTISRGRQDHQNAGTPSRRSQPGRLRREG